MTRQHITLKTGPIYQSTWNRCRRDARGRHWPNVRKWSQGVWDSIECKDYTWKDTQLIQNERFMICIAPPIQCQQGRNISSAPYTTGTHHPDERAGGTLCRVFNSRGGCLHRAHHDGYLHYCAYCDSLGKECNHSLPHCDRKVKDIKGEWPNNKKQPRPRSSDRESGRDRPQTKN